MSFKPYLFGFVVLPWLVLVILVNGAGQQPDLAGDSGISCEVTAPNGISAGAYEASPHDYGTLQLSVGPFGLWPEGTVVFKPGGAGFVTRDGALGMKWGWQRAVRGRLQITGRRLDAPAPTLRTEVSDGGQGAPQFLATYLIFPMPGCWEVTGRLGEATLTFVTRVVKIGAGPLWRRDPRVGAAN